MIERRNIVHNRPQTPPPFATATVNKLNRLGAFHAQFSSVSRKRIPPRRRKNRKCRTCADIEQQRSLPDVIGDL